MKVTTADIDLAKNVFQLHGVDEQGKTVLRKQLKREQVAQFFANLPTCLDWSGGVRERASLGSQAAVARSHGTPGGTAARQTVRQDQQERCC